MSNNLKKKINEHLNAYEIPTSEFEKKAGLANATVVKILEDMVKNPSIETIIKIADALECSLDELFDRKYQPQKPLFQGGSHIRLNIEMFRSICLYVIYFIESNRISDLTLERIGYVIEAIYKHSLENKSQLFDKEFAEWLLKNTLLR